MLCVCVCVLCRNPLHVVSSWLNIMDDDAEQLPPAERTRAVADMTASVALMQSTVDDVRGCFVVRFQSVADDVSFCRWMPQMLDYRSVTSGDYIPDFTMVPAAAVVMELTKRSLVELDPSVGCLVSVSSVPHGATLMLDANRFKHIVSAGITCVVLFWGRCCCCCRRCCVLCPFNTLR